MSAKPNSDGLDRRQFLRITAGAGAMGMGAQGLPNGPVQESEAIAVTTAAAIGIGSGLAVGAAVGYAFGGDDDFKPDADYQGPEAVQAEIERTARLVGSSQESVTTGLSNHAQDTTNIAVSEGKLNVYEKIDQQVTKQEVIDHGHKGVEDYYLYFRETIIKEWNERIRHLRDVINTLEQHDDTEPWNVLSANVRNVQSSANTTFRRLEIGENEIELSNGDTHTVLDVTIVGYYHGHDYELADTLGLNYRNTPINRGQMAVRNGGRIYANDQTLFDPRTYRDLWNQIDDLEQSAKDEITQFVDGTYNEVQDDSLSVEDITSPLDHARSMDNSQENPNSTAALMALGVPIDLDGETTIRMVDEDVTLSGVLAATESPEGGFEIGSVYDPNNQEDTTGDGTESNPIPVPGQVYLNYDASTGSGQLSTDAYRAGIDGGNLRFYEEPHPKSLYVVETVAGESARVTAEDFESIPEGWDANLSDQLEESMTEIDQVQIFSESDEQQYEMVTLEQPFEIVSSVDAEGNERETIQTESHNNQTPDNYVSQEEFEQWQEDREGFDEWNKDGWTGIGFLDNLGEIPAEGIVLIALSIVAFAFGR